MSVLGIQSTLSPQSVSQPSLSAGANGSESFSKVLENALDQVNQTSEAADSLAASYAAGGPVTLDQLMIAEQQASLSLDLVVQIRNRVVSAYQSIMNMQV
jgi:flagellar hook-basal body complex protein FliE